MQRTLLLLLWTVLFNGCKDSGNRTKATKQSAPLHFTTSDSNNIEPITLLNLRGIYYLFYATWDDADKRNILHQSTSKDLINWSESSQLLFPGFDNSSLRGGVILDSANTSGFGSNARPSIVAVFTASENTQSIKQEMKKTIPVLAYSIDDGKSWTVASDKTNFPPAFIDNPQNVGIV